MKLQDAIELLARMLMELLVAERKVPALPGPEKKKYVMEKLTLALQEPHSPPLIGMGDINEILELISQIVNLVVKLLTLLGVFRRAAKEGKPKLPPVNE